MTLKYVPAIQSKALWHPVNHRRLELITSASSTVTGTGAVADANDLMNSDTKNEGGGMIDAHNPGGTCYSRGLGPGHERVDVDFQCLRNFELFRMLNSHY